MNELEDLIKEVQWAQKNQQLENLLEGLLTPAEIREFSQRLEIIKLLKKGIPQHEIAARLKVGVATVSRGAKEILLGRFETVS